MSFTTLYLTDDAERFAAPVRRRVSGATILAANTIDDALDNAGAVDAVVSIGVGLPEDCLTHFPKLRWVQALTTGIDHFLPMLNRLDREVFFTNGRGAHVPAVSEMALMLMLAAARRLPEMMRNQTAHVYERVVGSLLDGRTVGVIGVGVIGLEIMRKCRAFNMKVIGFGSTVRNCPEADAFHSYAELAAVLPEIDFPVLVAPLTESTRGMIDRTCFDAMKPGAWFINVGRGGTVDEDAMIAALNSGRLAGAALDALSVEPLPRNSVLWDMDKVIITPHMAGDSDDFHERLAELVAGNIRAMMSGSSEDLINRVAYTRNDRL